MATTAEYLNQLQKDKETLVNNLVEKGVDASNEETFTSLAPKVADISSGDLSNFFNTTITQNQYGGLYVIQNLPNLYCTNTSITNRIFYELYGLKKMPVIEFENPNVFRAEMMFCNCKSLEDVSNLTKLTFTRNDSTNQMFYYCYNLKEIPFFDTSNVTNSSQMFYECESLITIPEFNFSKSKNVERMFEWCQRLETIPELDFSSATSLYNTFANCLKIKEINIKTSESLTSLQYAFRYTRNLESLSAIECSKVASLADAITDSSQNTTLTHLGGFINLGKAYTQKTTNYTNYTLNLGSRTALTHDSLMNVINGLYDLNLTYNVANGGTLYTQKLVLGSTNIAKLTDDEIAIATAKGWTITTR